MVYFNEIYQNINVGDRLDAYVKSVRQDGKIDLTLSDKTINRIALLSEQIYNWIKENGGTSSLNDKSTPDEIKAVFACSKKDYKTAIGLLYKNHRISISDNNISIL